MRLPLKIEYATRALVQLARTYERGEVRRAEELAEAEALSPHYLVQILNELRPAGLVASRRGKNGGYLLARRPEEISLLDIAQALEGRVLELNDPEGGESGPAAAGAWKEVFAGLEKALSEWTLADLLSDGSSADWVI
ncbi:MAG: Rrf2 family transcriptional regulator [Verrucomicrobiota bacterium]